MKTIALGVAPGWSIKANNPTTNQLEPFPVLGLALQDDNSVLAIIRDPINSNVGKIVSPSEAKEFIEPNRK
jgi:hypothetical protein